MGREPSRRRCRPGPSARLRNFDRISLRSFRRRPRRVASRFRPSAGSLGSANSLPFAVLVKPFFTSSLKIFIWVFATPTEICARDGSPRRFRRGSERVASPSYGPASYFALRGSESLSARRLSAIHFRGPLIRQVSYYTLFNCFLLP
jgi:hypothetical protein